MSRSDKGFAGSGEDGKVTSGQEGLQPVAVRDDNFLGPSGGANRNAPDFWLLLVSKVTPAQRDKDSAHAPKQIFFATSCLE